MTNKNSLLIIPPNQTTKPKCIAGAKFIADSKQIVIVI